MDASGRFWNGPESATPLASAIGGTTDKDGKFWEGPQTVDTPQAQSDKDGQFWEGPQSDTIGILTPMGQTISSNPM